MARLDADGAASGSSLATPAAGLRPRPADAVSATWGLDTATTWSRPPRSSACCKAAAGRSTRTSPPGRALRVGMRATVHHRRSIWDGDRQACRPERRADRLPDVAARLGPDDRAGAALGRAGRGPRDAVESRRAVRAAAHGTVLDAPRRPRRRRAPGPRRPGGPAGRVRPHRDRPPVRRRPPEARTRS